MGQVEEENHASVHWQGQGQGQGGQQGQCGGPAQDSGESNHEMNLAKDEIVFILRRFFLLPICNDCVR